MNNSTAFGVIALVVGAIGFWFHKSQPPAPDYAAFCVGPPLRTIEKRNEALEDGYAIHRTLDCIAKANNEEVTRTKRLREARLAVSAAGQPATDLEREPDAQSRAAMLSMRKTELAAPQTLGEARKDFKTVISNASTGTPPLPRPPPNLFVRLDYVSGKHKLPAFVTPDPRDGEKHAAIVWLTGGDTNSLDDFWSPQPESNDQTARPFRDAGLVMMFPSLRGGNANPGGKEYFLGEVDDVLAGAESLARLPYVDPARIYLGGHSTGGTLALLVAESSGRFKSVFALAPVAKVNDYPPSLAPYNFFAHGEMEHRLRSPIYWLAGITSPTYVIEGTTAPSNVQSFEEVCQKSANPQVLCIPVAGSNHFSVVSRITKVIAARIAVPKDGVKWLIRPEEFQ
jgi:acetyl esterase/lipase